MASFQSSGSSPLLNDFEKTKERGRDNLLDNSFNILGCDSSGPGDL